MRFDKRLLADYSDVFRARCRIRLKPRFACRQEHMRGSSLVNACGQRHNQHRVGALMAVTRIHRNDDYRPSTFFRRVNVELYEPDLAAKRGPFHGARSSRFTRKFFRRELAPALLLNRISGRKRIVIIGNRSLQIFLGLYAPHCL